MNQWRGFLVLIFAMMLLVKAEAAQQQAIQWRGSGGWGAGLPYGRAYDTATVQKLSGEVSKLEKLVPEPGMADGLYLILRTRDITIPVHLGPLWYLERQDFGIEKGEQIEVVGSRINFDGSSAMIAREIRKADKVLLLREESGIPLWSGWRRR